MTRCYSTRQQITLVWGPPWCADEQLVLLRLYQQPNHKFLERESEAVSPQPPTSPFIELRTMISRPDPPFVGLNSVSTMNA